MPCSKYKSEAQRHLCFATAGWKNWKNIKGLKHPTHISAATKKHNWMK